MPVTTRRDTRVLQAIVQASEARALALVQRIGEAWLAETQARAPVKTGRLRDSYHFEITEQTPTRITGTLATDVPYAPHQEYGTVHQAGTPHIGPAADAVRPAFEAGLADLLKP
jgi:hypothetical protein